MDSKKKFFRYYYWLVLEFIKKYSKTILISFFISFIIFIVFLSLTPYIKILATKEKIIGLVGNYNLENPPDEVVSKISNSLIIIDEKGKIIPVIANSWEIKDEGKIYRFHLKDNLYWNDGKKFSAKEIQFQFEDVEIKPVDERTIDFILKKPLAIFPNYLNKPIIRYPLVGVAGYYRVGKVKTKSGFLKEISLIPNIKNIPPIKYRFYQSESQMVDAYKKGEIKEMTVYKKSIADVFSKWKNSKVSQSVDYTRLLTIFYNFNNPVLKNKNIREALAMLIDVKKFSQYGEIAKGPIPPNSWAYNPDLKNYSYDLETAKKIIEKENIASLSSQLNFYTFYDYYQIADDYVTELNKVNLPAEIKISSVDRPENFDFLLAYWKVPTDPDQYFFWHSTQKLGNIGDYKNVKVDLLLEKGRSTIDIQEREKIYFDFQKVITDDPPALFLYYPYVYKIERK